jgi:hypothetical protein
MTSTQQRAELQRQIWQISRSHAPAWERIRTLNNG